MKRNVMNKPKTIFCDIDGTLCYYPYSSEMGNYDFDKKVMQPLPGTLKKLWDWDKAGHVIILTTGRKEGMRESTERQLREAGVIYDRLIMGIGGGTRVLINDLKADRDGDTAIAINLKRDTGVKDVKI
jgi:FMN phosphatase YigB (HAD superfamily)